MFITHFVEFRKFMNKVVVVEGRLGEKNDEFVEGILKGQMT